MKYPWVGITIMVIWGGSALIAIFRDNSDPTLILLFASIATAIIAYLGFRSPS